MRVLMSVWAVLASLPAIAAQAPFPAGYWERSYGFGDSAAQISVSLRVKDMVRGEIEVDRLLTKSGAVMKSLNQNYVQQGGSGRYKSLSYFIATDKADAAAKSIINAGELLNFSNNRSFDGSQGEELRRKIQQLEEESAGNAEILKKMPIASYFLNTNLTRLRQSREAMDAAVSRTTINVTLSEPRGETKK